MKYNSASDIDAHGYDRIIEKPGEGVTYLMRMDTKRYKKGESALDQPIWQIKKITEVTENGVTTTDIQYAHGTNGYCNVASEYESIEYKYNED